MNVSTDRRVAAQETLERSIRMAPVQRRGLAVILVALILSAGSIGWMALVPLAASFVAFLVIKAPPVQRALGVWSLGAVWAAGEGGSVGAVLLADGPAEYMISLMAIPTILGSVVWPKAWVRVAAFATAGLMLGAGAAVDPAYFAANLVHFCLPAAICVAASLMTLVARDAEASTRERSERDPLTGVLNRAALVEARGRITALPPSTRGALALIVADVDAFKQINDRHGHDRGDRALAAVADVLRETVGTAGEVYRFGGEEFVVLVEGADATGAAELAERMREAVAALAHDVPMTLSLGVATLRADQAGTFDELFARADARLLVAKREGRNRVVVEGAAPPSFASVTPSVTEPAVTDLDLPDTEAAPRRGQVIRTMLDRMHLVAMSERQHRSNPLAYLIIVATMLTFVGTVGWGAIGAGVASGLIFRLAQRRVSSLRRPEIVLGVAWLVAQALVALAVVLVEVDALWGLPVLACMLVANSASFPGRLTAIGAAYTGALVIAAAALIDPRVFSQSIEAIVIPLAVMMTATITGRAVGRLAVSIRTVGAHDALTGLPNRTACAEAAAGLIRRARDDGQQFAMIVGDLDHFKDVNDTFGHAQGDAVLIALVSRLAGELRPDAMLFRLGGEEFGILVAGIDGDGARRLAERLRSAVGSRPLAGSAVTISFGVALSDPAGSDDYGQLFRRADQALYLAKRSGRNRVAVDDRVPLGARPVADGAFAQS